MGDAPITPGDAEKWGIEICLAVADVAMGVIIEPQTAKGYWAAKVRTTLVWVIGTIVRPTGRARF